MKNRFYVILTICFLTIAVNAQNNYKRGYIITNEKDTIVGLIDFRTDRQNGEECKFKTNELSQLIRYYPGDIFGYRFIDEGKYYVSRDIDLRGENHKVFLEFMVQGVMSLYYHDDGEQLYYLFENESGEMNVVTKEADKIENLKIIPDNKYKGKIKYAFREYESITKVTDKLEFNQKSMIDITKRYHDEVCTTGEDCIVFQNENPDKSTLIFKVSAFGGVQFITYRYHMYKNISGIDLSSVAPVIGGNIELSNPRWSKLLSLQMGITFSKVNKKETKKVEIRKGVIVDRELGYKLNVLQPRLGVNFLVPIKKRLYPNIGAGFVYTKLISSSSEMEKYEMKDEFYGIYGTVGVNYKIRKDQIIFLNCLYDMNIGGYDRTKVNGGDKLKTLSLNLGYRF